jgi:hypothetical protein
VDELELVSQALEVTPWQPEAYERARAKLQAAMVESGALPETTSAPLPGKVFLRAGSRRRLSFGTRGKVGAGIGALAAAAAAVVAITSTSPPVAPSGGTPASSQAPVVQSELMTLVANLTTTNSQLPGNASLIIRTQTIGDRSSDASYNLYTDDGAYYVGGDKMSLMKAVARKEDLADGIYAREVAAARDAVKGDIEAARKQMVNAAPNDLGLGLSDAARQKIWDKARAENADIFKKKGIKVPAHPPTGKLLQVRTGNLLWNNSVDALSAGAGNPQVRAGALRLLDSIPEVTVKKSKTDGESTLTLTAGSELFGGGAPQVLTVDAKTGMPIKSVFEADGDLPSSVQEFQVSRLTLARIKAGKF